MIRMATSPGWIRSSQAQALLATTMASFLVYAAIVMAVFHARSAVRAWMWLAVAAVLPPVRCAPTLNSPLGTS
jgi:hypothetical protein